MQLSLQHYLIFLPPLPSMKIEPQPEKEQLLVVIQTIMPESSLRLGEVCLVFCTAPFIVKGLQNCPHLLCPGILPLLARSGECRGIIHCEASPQPCAPAGSPAAGLPVLPLVAGSKPRSKLSLKPIPFLRHHALGSVTMSHCMACTPAAFTAGLEKISWVTTYCYRQAFNHTDIIIIKSHKYSFSILGYVETHPNINHNENFKEN